MFNQTNGGFAQKLSALHNGMANDQSISKKMREIVSFTAKGPHTKSFSKEGGGWPD